MKTSVLIPTWRRPVKFRQALESIVQQSLSANEVVVVYRDIDRDSLNIINDFKNKLPLKIIEVTISGVIHAENKGMEYCRGDIVCFMDDDARAPVDWLEKIVAHFERDSSVVGVGGPDFILNHGESNYRKTVDQVGKITWYGKVIGNHHHLCEKLMKVDVLKGVNMSFRREVLSKLDVNLQSDHNVGNGSHWELDLCFSIRKNGGILLFDPSLDIIHDSNHDHFVKYENIRNNARNLIYVMLKNLSFSRKTFFIFYIFMIGNDQLWGLGKLFHSALYRGPIESLKSYFYSNWGVILGLKLSFRRIFLDPSQP